MPSSEKSSYVLDTNILIHAVRGSETWQRVKMIFNPLMVEPRPYIGVVTDGELRSFAKQQSWGDVKRNQMEFLLDYFTRTTIDDEEILKAYANIDAYSRQSGVKMGKNDLWIAATAKVYEATLVTTDRDFEHLHDVVLERLLILPGAIL